MATENDYIHKASSILLPPSTKLGRASMSYVHYTFDTYVPKRCKNLEELVSV